MLSQFQERHKSALVVDGIAGRSTVTYLAWGAGSAVVTDIGAERHFALDFEYKFYDRHN